MHKTGLNRRDLVAGAGALAARSALPLSISAGGILVPQVAHASTVTLSAENAVSSRMTVDGKDLIFIRWPQSNGDVFSYIRVPNGGPIIFAAYSHMIDGVRHISKYKSCTIIYNGTGVVYSVTFPSHVHRVRRAQYTRDINADGSTDFKPPIAWKNGTNAISTSFDTTGSWGIDYLIYKTWRNSTTNVEFVQGAVKSDLDDGLTPEWIGFYASGSARTTVMTHINELKREHDATKSTLGAAAATSVVGTILIGTAVKFAAGASLTPVAPVAAIAVCTIGVLLVINSGQQWVAHKNAVSALDFDKRQFESYVRGRTTGKIIYT